MKIEVTQEDIDKGQRNTCTLCPIAIAIKRREHTRKDVFVDSETVRVGYTDFCTPRRVQRFIERFDTGKPVKPFSFEL